MLDEIETGYSLIKEHCPDTAKMDWRVGFANAGISLPACYVMIGQAYELHQEDRLVYLMETLANILKSTPLAYCAEFERSSFKGIIEQSISEHTPEQIQILALTIIQRAFGHELNPTTKSLLTDDLVRIVVEHLLQPSFIQLALKCLVNISSTGRHGRTLILNHLPLVYFQDCLKSHNELYWAMLMRNICKHTFDTGAYVMLLNEITRNWTTVKAATLVHLVQAMKEIRSQLGRAFLQVFDDSNLTQVILRAFGSHKESLAFETADLLLEIVKNGYDQNKLFPILLKGMESTNAPIVFDLIGQMSDLEPFQEDQSLGDFLVGIYESGSFHQRVMALETLHFVVVNCYLETLEHMLEFHIFRVLLLSFDGSDETEHSRLVMTLLDDIFTRAHELGLDELCCNSFIADEGLVILEPFQDEDDEVSKHVHCFLSAHIDQLLPNEFGD